MTPLRVRVRLYLPGFLDRIIQYDRIQLGPAVSQIIQYRLDLAHFGQRPTFARRH